MAGVSDETRAAMLAQVDRMAATEGQAGAPASQMTWYVGKVFRLTETLATESGQFDLNDPTVEETADGGIIRATLVGQPFTVTIAWDLVADPLGG
jgi:hypothetical protein